MANAVYAWAGLDELYDVLVLIGSLVGSFTQSEATEEGEKKLRERYAELLDG